MSDQKHILISGVGNVLQQDDGFGIEVVCQLQKKNGLPDYVKIMETGIGGIHLVQELSNGYEVLILIDAVSRDGEPGQIYMLEANVPDINEFSFDEKSDFLADMHFTNPTRALMLAKALNYLPGKVYILGCQPAAYQKFELGLSEEVSKTIPYAIELLEDWVKQYYKAIENSGR